MPAPPSTAGSAESAPKPLGKVIPLCPLRPMRERAFLCEARHVMTSPLATPRWREAIRLILPKEHGSWSLALEPLMLGLIVAPSAAGGALAFSVLAAFFLRRPLKLWLGGGADPRRPQAFLCVVILAAMGMVGLILAAILAGPARLWPLLLAVPPGAAFVWFDSRGESREAAAEIAGSIAFAAAPAALASLAGWPADAALAVAVVMASRSVPAILTIRAYLRRNKGLPVSIAPALTTSVAAVLASALLARAGLAPWTATVVMILLLVRAGLLLGLARPRLPANRVGIAESVLGGVLVIVLALSWIR